MPKLSNLVHGTMLEIYSFLDHRELYTYGCSCRMNFMLFLIEKEARKAPLRSTSRFLPRGWKRESVALVSYPRSGNSFLRRVLEKWSGIVTGTDSRPNRTLSASLLRCGFRGEGITDESVWLVKTHYPERLGYMTFVANRGVLIIRNPFDTIESYFHMGMTNTHDKSLTRQAFTNLQEIWEAFMINEIKIWQQFHAYWLSGARVVSQTNWGSVVTTNQTQLLVIRYEDLLLHKEKVLELLFSYLGGQDTHPLGLNLSTASTTPAPPAATAPPPPAPVPVPVSPAEAPATEPPSLDSSVEPGYLPRQGGSVGKALHRYSISQIEQLKDIAGAEFLSCLGYDVFYNSIGEGSSGCEDKWIDLKPMELGRISCSSSATDVSSCSSGGGRLIVNSPHPLRRDDDQFGRNITFLRKSLTSEDTKPFDTL